LLDFRFPLRDRRMEPQARSLFERLEPIVSAMVSVAECLRRPVSELPASVDFEPKLAFIQLGLGRAPGPIEFAPNLAPECHQLTTAVEDARSIGRPPGKKQAPRSGALDQFAETSAAAAGSTLTFIRRLSRCSNFTVPSMRAKIV
jgi:hypothetical protein